MRLILPAVTDFPCSIMSSKPGEPQSYFPIAQNDIGVLLALAVPALPPA
jgi:hypothetical protein